MMEREVKLALPGRFHVPELLLDGMPLDQDSLPDLNLRATYFDTADLRLARAGATLRFRTAPLFNALERRREVAHAELARALEAGDYPQLIEELVATLAEPPAGAGADRLATTELPRLALAAWGRLARRVRHLDASAPDDRFHQARIAAKQARYAAELASRTLTGKQATGAERFAARLAEVQDLLGEMQDAAVAEATIRATLASRSRRASYAFEAGRLVERQRSRAIAARTTFLETWPDVRRGRWRRWAL